MLLNFYFSASGKRDNVVTVKPNIVRKREVRVNDDSQQLQNDPIYSTTCCKIDLSSPRKRKIMLSRASLKARRDIW